MPEDNTAKQPPSRQPASPGKQFPNPEGICPKCKSASTCRRYELASGPVWYCVRFDVPVSE